ncbi:MAG: diacylglycerol kinase family protein, partial [Pseudomonadota bacterium]
MATSIYEFSQIPRVEAGPGRGERRPFVRDSGEAPRVGVIYNPRSHRNQGTDFDCGVSPLVHISQPSARAQLPQALEELAEQGLDLLVINGGDGTVRDVLTFGHAVFGDDWPMVAVLPKGKTNALTVDLGVPAEWTLQHAIDALEKGKSVRRRPIAIAPVDGASDHLKSPQVLGFILGAGAFTTAIRAGQSAHRLGAFNGVAVGVTALWGLAHSVFGGRGHPWRSGA